MSLTVGRHLIPEGFSSWTATGPDVTLAIGTVVPPLSLVTDPARVAWAKAVLMSMSGMVDEVVPITSTEWPEIDGIYRVTAAPSTHPVSLATGVVDLGTIQARRLSGGVARGLVSVVGGARTATAPVGAFPSGATYVGVPGWVGAAVTVDESMVDADGLQVHRVSVPSGALTDVAAEIPARQFYAGGARVEAQIGGAWVAMHGSQIPPGASVRLGNGLVRVTLAAASIPATNLNPLWEQWSGSAWQPVALRLTDTSGLVSYRGLSGVEVVAEGW